MKIVELDIRVPYESRGRILRRILSKVKGRIRDIHFLPPDATGMSEVRMELVGGKDLIGELKRVVKNGKVSFRILSEA